MQPQKLPLLLFYVGALCCIQEHAGWQLKYFLVEAEATRTYMLWWFACVRKLEM